jgi:hypothetical protein
LAERQISGSASFEAGAKRVKILVRSADFLWKIDSQNPRKYFAGVFQTADFFLRKKVSKPKTTVVI